MTTLSLDDVNALVQARPPDKPAGPKKLSIDDVNGLLAKRDQDIPDIHAAEDAPPGLIRRTLGKVGEAVDEALAPSREGMTEAELPPEVAQKRKELPGLAGFSSTTSQPREPLDAETLWLARKQLLAELKQKGQDPRTSQELLQLNKRLERTRTQGTEDVVGMASGGAGGAGVVPALTRGAKALPGALSKLARVPGKTTVRRLTGSEAREALEGVRSEATKRVGKAAADETQTAATAGAQAEQLKAGALKAARPERVEQQVAPQAAEHAVAKTAAEEAKARAGEAAQRVQDAEGAATQLEKTLLARPAATAEEFGTELRKTTAELYERHAATRAKEAGFDKALEDAGDTPRVDTAPAQKQIDASLKDIRNPSLQRVLTGVRDLLTTAGSGPDGAVAVDKLSVRAADSLRKYLDGVIQSKTFGDQAIDKETLYVVKQIKRALVESATQTWTPYRDALAKWRTLSRPLDIVERNGALRKVLDRDPVSTDYALTEAQVVGHILAKAKAGSPTLTRLATDNPGLRDSARLYFTHDLFGKEAVPTDASLRTWLKGNEPALRQLGLYDEFRSIRAAKEAAQRAVEEAKGVSKETMATARQAQRQEVATRQQLAKAKAVREQNQKKLVGRLEQKQSTAEKTKMKAESAADTYRRFELRLSDPKIVVDKALPKEARALVEELRTAKRINDKTYAGLLRNISDAEAKAKSSADLRKNLRRLALVAVLSTAGYHAYRGLAFFLGSGH